METLFEDQQTVILTREDRVHYFLPNIVSITISCSENNNNNNNRLASRSYVTVPILRC